MKYEAVNNIPWGWEVVEMTAIPARTFVIELTQEQAEQIVAELNTLASQLGEKK